MIKCGGLAVPFHEFRHPGFVIGQNQLFILDGGQEGPQILFNQAGAG
ncbi:hypothetical protein [Magnetospirillum gryphiswaldense]|nr:hypothetical protein [Magnetospirillum gryphiswaldense]